MPGTSAGRAARLYERFRLELPTHGPTFSAGVADYPHHARTADKMFERAAEMLYRARAEGGDRCHVYPTERRRTPRLPATFETLAVELLEPADGTALRPRDVSRDGFGLRLESPLPVGARVRLRLSVRDRGESVDLHGRVVRARRLEQGPPAERYEVGVGLEPSSFLRVDPVAFCRRAERSPDHP